MMTTICEKCEREFSISPATLVVGKLNLAVDPPQPYYVVHCDICSEIYSTFNEKQLVLVEKLINEIIQSRHITSDNTITYEYHPLASFNTLVIRVSINGKVLDFRQKLDSDEIANASSIQVIYRHIAENIADGVVRGLLANKS